jgi:hypothetical protein
MTRFFQLATVVGFVTLLSMADASAWGPRAQRSISYMALQVLQKDYPDVLRDYHQDIIRGAEDGFGVIAETLPLHSDTDAMVAVGAQMLLLREVRNFGVDEYFAYRMGVLASLTSDILMPYGFAWSPEEERLQAVIGQDVDEHIESFAMDQGAGPRTYLRNSLAYFAEHRRFLEENERIIAEDYRSGLGYRGLLREGAPKYFNRCINAVADVWHTVLRTESDSSDRPASREMLTWYFAREIEYMLNVKKNFRKADLAFNNFQDVNPGIMESYDQVGDLYYAFDSDDSIRRAVDTWRLAYSLPGAVRDRVGAKLSQHFMNVGISFFEKEKYNDEDLPSALTAFQESLSYDRENASAAGYIQQVNRKIEERAELRRLYEEMLSSAESIRAKAGRATLDGDYGSAIAELRNAIKLLDGLGDEFPSIYASAQSSASGMRKEISNVLQEIIGRATAAIDEGDGARDSRNYEAAIRSYAQVEIVLDEIPEDASQSFLEDKAELLLLAQTKTEEAKREQADYERRQREAAQQPGAAAGGAGGAGGAPRPGAAQ